ncbi:MAG: MarP family serine protease [Chloroflexota bacterium]|nr:MarP family serine protease [Chloroflexota bacterium]MDH5242786.1 MarP family serine protease [Chloroflexota bacterium]
MNPIDVIAILLVILAVLLGYRSGALPQLSGLLGAVAGGALAILALPLLAEPIGDIPPGFRPFVVLAGLLVAVILGEWIGSAIGRRFARALGTGALSSADRAAGAFVGAAQALLIVWLAGGLLAIGSVPRLTDTARTSEVVRGLDAVLPPPTEVAAGLGELLDTTYLPEVFVGFEPLPRPAVDRPTSAAVQAFAASAAASTMRVTAAACGLVSSGSGILVADRYVVTNAHVIAGAHGDGIRVSTADGTLADATVVLFDPDFDVALLHTDRIAATPLRFASTDPERGDVGAALGYPGGGGLKVIPAAVTGVYAATGRDIYGRDPIRREVLELRAEINRGDSGGPFILPDGTVGGLVFAEARTSDDVGYALAPTAVATRIAAGLGRTSAVTTGDCVR